MPRTARDQLRCLGLLAWVLLAVACSRQEPNATVSDLNWACGSARCTASFRVSADASSDQPLLVLVRAYAGDSVAAREIVGEHRERTVVPAGQSKRFSVSVETRRPATRLRVILERAD